MATTVLSKISALLSSILLFMSGPVVYLLRCNALPFSHRMAVEVAVVKSCKGKSRNTAVEV